MTSSPIRDLFDKPPIVPEVVLLPLKPSSPPPQLFQTIVVLFLMGWLLFVSWKAFGPNDGRKEHRQDQQEEVNPKPVSLEGHTLVFVYEMKSPSANQVEVVGSLAELEKRLGLRMRVLLDDDMEDAPVVKLIKDAEQKNIKTPFMALTKDSKLIKAAPFPETITHADIEAFVK